MSLQNTQPNILLKQYPPGQETMTLSLPVVIASNQSAIPVSQSGSWTVVLGSGSAVIGHVITDSGSVTNASQAGTWTVQPGNTANTTPWLTTINQGGNSAAVTGANALKVDGSAVTQPISGTVTANQGGTWNINNISGTISLPTGAATEATLATLSLSQGSTTSGEKGPLIQGAVTTAAPIYTTAQTSPLSLTTAGALRTDSSGSTQPISGTVTANQGTSPWVTSASQSGSWTVTANAGTNLNTSALALDTSVNGILLSQGSTTSGEKGPLIQGAVTTSAPSYTTAQTSPLSLTTSGLLRVDASGTTVPISGTIIANQGTSPWVTSASQSGTWTVQPGNTANTTPWLTTINQGGNNAAVTGANALKVDGSAVTQPVSGTVTANQGGAPWSSNITQIGGSSLTLGQKTMANSIPITIASDQSAIPVTSSLSATSTGMTRYRNTTLSNTAAAVKASAGNLFYYHVYNNNTADSYLQFYNVAAGSVTVGTTTPDWTLAIPAGGVLDGTFDSAPCTFSTAITIAATTTITGGSAPSTGLLVALGYV